MAPTECLPSFFACLPAFLPARLPACLSSCLHTCLPACLPACACTHAHTTLPLLELLLEPKILWIQIILTKLAVINRVKPWFNKQTMLSGIEAFRLWLWLDNNNIIALQRKSYRAQNRITFWCNAKQSFKILAGLDLIYIITKWQNKIFLTFNSYSHECTSKWIIAISFKSSSKNIEDKNLL